MIVRNNEKIITQCLAGILPWVDEAIVVDTGSTDRTPSIAMELGAQVRFFPWCDDFSAARNESLRFATQPWIFWMDSDDTIDAENGQKLRQLVDCRHDDSILGYVMQVRCPAAVNGLSDFTQVDHIKLFRNQSELRFEGRIHEQVLPSIRRLGGNVAWTDIFVRHSGSDQSTEGRSRKHQRDLHLLQLELRDRPEHPFGLFNLGMTLADMGEHDRAADALARSILVSAPNESHVRKAYALVVASLTELGRLEGAWEACSKGLSLFPQDVELLFRRGILAHRLGLFEEAVASYTLLLAQKEERHFASVDVGIRGPKARHNLAVVYRDMGKLSDSERQWRSILREMPTNATALRALGEILLQQGKTTCAAAEATRFMNDKVLQPVAFSILAAIARTAGDWEQATHLMLAAVENYPDNEDCLRALCELHFQQDQLLQAEQCLLRMIVLNPADASIFHNLGTVYLRLERLPAAARAYRESLRLRPDFPATSLQLAFVVQRMEQSIDENLAAETRFIGVDS